MTNQPTEIAIVGGGMVGGALALGVCDDLAMLENAGSARICGNGDRARRTSAVCR